MRNLIFLKKSLKILNRHINTSPSFKRKVNASCLLKSPSCTSHRLHGKDTKKSKKQNNDITTTKNRCLALPIFKITRGVFFQSTYFGYGNTGLNHHED